MNEKYIIIDIGHLQSNMPVEAYGTTPAHANWIKLSEDCKNKILDCRRCRLAPIT